jgi:hypothetical protein
MGCAKEIVPETHQLSPPRNKAAVRSAADDSTPCSEPRNFRAIFDLSVDRQLMGMNAAVSRSTEEKDRCTSAARRVAMTSVEEPPESRAVNGVHICASHAAGA